MKTVVTIAIVVAGALICGAGQEPEGAPDAPLDEWEQLAGESTNIAGMTTWHVDDDNCPKPGSGTEADPFCLIQDCIDAAVDGDECVVAPGTYFENINFLGKAITLRSSDGAEVTIIDAADNGTVATCETNEGPGTVINGFTITGGNALNGGGMYNLFSSPTVISCTFSENAAGGGGMYNNHSSPTVANCTFSGNSAHFFGGGIYNFESNPTVANCTFSGNTADFGGGGMYNRSNSSPTVTNCAFSENRAGGRGGGMYNNRSGPTVTHCTFSGNSAAFFGGGMINFNSSPAVTNCTFSGNSAGSRGGGMHNVLGSPTVINCAFNGNSASGDGGGMYNSFFTVLAVANCTFSGNDADNGRALASDSFSQLAPSDLSMTNCILWDGGDEVWNNDNSMISIAYTDVQGGWPGEGNIDATPLFIDPAIDNYRLSAGSPCIDAADNTAVPEGIVSDLDGNPRFVDDPNTDDTGFGEPPIVDMGAYEFRDPCADDDRDGRVTICHVPRGNPDNAHTITASVNALRAHLAHGDYCGPCEHERSTDSEAGRKAPPEEKRTRTIGPLDVVSP